MKWRSLAVVVVVSLLALSTAGCAITNLLKREVSEKIEEVASEEAEEVASAEGEAKAEAAKAASPTKPPAGAKPTKAPSPTATAEPEEEAPLSLASLEELNSYRQVTTMSGTQGDEEWEMEIVSEFVREPPAQRYVMKGVDENGQDISMAMIRIGDTTYMRGSEGEWISMTSSESLDPGELPLLRPEDTFYTEECKYKGSEQVNGLQAKYYVCEKEALFSMPWVGGTIESGRVDTWVSTEYGVGVKMTFDAQGQDEEGVKVKTHWEFEVTDINKPINIEAPEGVAAAGLPDDIPMIDGAYEVNAIMGMVGFKVDKAVAEVAKFYQAAMARNGWTPEEGAMMPDMLNFSKGNRTANLILSEEGAATQVTIMVNEE
ncbi:MAG TPA: hypothetical protein VMX14_09180 [Anaerolineae bacterium]|nr:hypothetical protein [Anaerolineae bacterium]